MRGSGVARLDNCPRSAQIESTSAKGCQATSDNLWLSRVAGVVLNVPIEK